VVKGNYTVRVSNAVYMDENQWNPRQSVTDSRRKGDPKVGGSSYAYKKELNMNVSRDRITGNDEQAADSATPSAACNQTK
jgi:hypothetical protein